MIGFRNNAPNKFSLFCGIRALVILYTRFVLSVSGLKRCVRQSLAITLFAVQAPVLWSTIKESLKAFRIASFAQLWGITLHSIFRPQTDWQCSSQNSMKRWTDWILLQMHCCVWISFQELVSWKSQIRESWVLKLGYASRAFCPSFMCRRTASGSWTKKTDFVYVTRSWYMPQCIIPRRISHWSSRVSRQQ